MESIEGCVACTKNCVIDDLACLCFHADNSCHHCLDVKHRPFKDEEAHGRQGHLHVFFHVGDVSLIEEAHCQCFLKLIKLVNGIPLDTKHHKVSQC